MRALTDNELTAIIEAMETGSEGRATEAGVTYRANPRVATALKFQALTGLRIGDVLALKMNSFKSERGNIRFDIIEEKTGKKRVFDVPPAAYNMLTAYAMERGITDKNAFLFAGKDGSHITARAVQKYLAIVCEDLGIDDVSTHSFRKWYATDKYNRSGHNIEAVRQLLQHSSTTITQRYLGVTNEEVNELARSATLPF